MVRWWDWCELVGKRHTSNPTSPLQYNDIRFESLDGSEGVLERGLVRPFVRCGLEVDNRGWGCIERTGEFEEVATNMFSPITIRELDKKEFMTGTVPFRTRPSHHRHSDHASIPTHFNAIHPSS